MEQLSLQPDATDHEDELLLIMRSSVAPICESHLSKQLCKRGFVSGFHNTEHDSISQISVEVKGRAELSVPCSIVPHCQDPDQKVEQDAEQKEPGA